MIADVSVAAGGTSYNPAGARIRRLYDDPQRQLRQMPYSADGVYMGLMSRPPQVTAGRVSERLAAGVSFPHDMSERGWPDPRPDDVVRRIDAASAERISDLAWKAAEVGAHAPERFTDDALGRALAEEVYACFDGAFAKADTVRSPAAFRHYNRIMRRIDDYIDAHFADRIVANDVAKAAGVSWRTIHNVMNAVCGKSLYRYLRERRLWAVRQALLDPNEPPLIKQAALANGFWHLGRFSRQYCELFGELPAQTLKGRPA